MYPTKPCQATQASYNRAQEYLVLSGAATDTHALWLSLWEQMIHMRIEILYQTRGGACACGKAS